jgi:hypothetical protein
MRQPPCKTTFENEVLSNEVFTDRFGGVCGVPKEFLAVSEKPPTPKPVCSGRRSLQPDCVSKDDRAQRNNARYGVAEKGRIEMFKIA